MTTGISQVLHSFVLALAGQNYTKEKLEKASNLTCILTLCELNTKSFTECLKLKISSMSYTIRKKTRRVSKAGIIMRYPLDKLNSLFFWSTCRRLEPWTYNFISACGYIFCKSIQELLFFNELVYCSNHCKHDPFVKD